MCGHLADRGGVLSHHNLHGKAESRNGRASTGVLGLDEVLAGGLPIDHLYLIEGDPGTGKTTLALQFLLEGVRRGERCLYVTLSESKHELLGVAESHGWDISGIPIYEMAPQEDEFTPEAQYTVFHPSDVELADTTRSVLKRVEEVNPSRVVFDSLSELRMLARDPLRYRRQILGLKRHFADRQCTVILLDDRTAEGNDLQLQSIAHGVIIMQSLEREFGVKRRRLEVRKMRGSRYREGYHDYTIEKGGVHVYPRLVASEHLSDFKRRPVLSGVRELDQLLGGGLDSGTSTLLIGPAGCGKSTVATRYAISAAERGERAAMFTFDETAGTLLYRAAELGMPLKKYMENGLIHLEQVDPAEMSPGAFIVGLRDIVQKGKAKVVVIDSLNGFLNAMPGEDFLTLQLHEVLSYMNQQGVATIMTLAQHGFVGVGMQSPVDVSYLADCVLLFRYFEAKGEVRQAISVVKKRSGHHERSIRELIFKNGGIAVGPTLRHFEGVLTGVPKHTGVAEELSGGSNTQAD
jgi:circadian clock protein KaiC